MVLLAIISSYVGTCCQTDAATILALGQYAAGNVLPRVAARSIPHRHSVGGATWGMVRVSESGDRPGDSANPINP